MHHKTALGEAHGVSPGMSLPSPLSASTVPSCNRKSAGATGPLLEFRLFADLPTELRLKIWRHALFLQRIVEVRAHERTHWRSCGTLPARTPYSLLRTCRESREETRKNLHASDVGPFSEAPWWVMWDVDMFYFDFSICVQLYSSLGIANHYLQRVRHLVLPSRLFDEKHPRPYASTLIITFFRNVEDVTVILVEGQRTSSAAELITLTKAAERNLVASRLVGTSEIDEMKLRLREFEARLRNRFPDRQMPVFRLMAMDRVDGVNMANSLISFRI